MFCFFVLFSAKWQVKNIQIWMLLKATVILNYCQIIKEEIRFLVTASVIDSNSLRTITEHCVSHARKAVQIQAKY